MELCAYKDQIRELDTSDLEFVAGGGIFSPTNLLNARNFAGGIGLVYASYRIGWDIGSYAYSTYNNYKYNSR